MATLENECTTALQDCLIYIWEHAMEVVNSLKIIHCMDLKKKKRYTKSRAETNTLVNISDLKSWILHNGNEELKRS